MWDKLNTSFKWAVIAAGLALAVWLYFQLKPKPEIPVAGPGLPIEIKEPVSENSPLVPAPKKKQGGVLVIVKQPTSVTDRPETLTVVVPRNPREDPPTVFGDSGDYRISWTPIRDPYASFESSLHLGASIDTEGRISPWFGAGFFQVFGVDFGACADLYGGGVFVAVETLPSLTVNASYRILGLRSEYRGVCLGLAYRF